MRLVEFLVGPLAPDARINLADALVAPDVLRPFLMNWADVVRYFIRSVEADAAADGTGETSELLERLLGYEGVRSALKAPASVRCRDGPVLPMHFRKGDVSLQLFTTIATLGTPQDITLQELRIECFFPMDRRQKRCCVSGPPRPMPKPRARKRRKPLKSSRLLSRNRNEIVANSNIIPGGRVSIARRSPALSSES